MRFNNFPLIYEALYDEGLKPIEVAPNGNLKCVNKAGDEFLMKDCRGAEEKIFTRVFPKIVEMKLNFETLVLPEYLKIVTKEVGDEKNKKKHKFILVNFYEGTSFNETWNEGSPDGYGGRGVDTSMGKKVVDLLEDFSSIDIAQLKPFNLLTFDFNKWMSKNLPYKAEKLIKHKIITSEQADKAKVLLGSQGIFQGSKMAFTNGDFYPRNFIELANKKIVVLDWEGREDYGVQINVNGEAERLVGQRNAFVNFIENHMAFFFVHMWGNYKIQRDFIRMAAKKFNIATKNLQAALIIKSLEQALHFHRYKPLAIRQAEVFVNSLEKRFVEDLLS